MFGWFKKTEEDAPQGCTAEDIDFITLLCFGRRATEAELGRIEPHFYTNLRLTLATRPFHFECLEALMSGKSPAQLDLTDNDIALLLKGTKRRFRAVPPRRTAPGLIRLECLRIAFGAELFQKAFLFHYSDGTLASARSALDAACESARTTIRGLIEGVRNEVCRGHAYDSAAPGQSLTLDFYVNGLFAGTSTANHLRRDLQEKLGNEGLYGFEHRLRLPDQLADATRLRISVYDHASGQAIAPAQEFLTFRPHQIFHLERLAYELKALREQGADISDYADTIRQLEATIPGLERYAAFPIENYDAYAGTFAPKPVELAAGPRFSVTVTGDDPAARGATVQSLEAQSYGAYSLDGADADLQVYLRAGDKLTPHALASLTLAAAANPDAQVFTADFDTARDDGTLWPHFLGAFDYDLLLGQGPHSRAFAVRTPHAADGPAESLFRAYEAGGASAFCHVPDVLFHLVQPLADADDHAKAVRSHLARAAQGATATALADSYGGNRPDLLQISWPTSADAHKLAVIIPTYNGLDMLRPCVESLRATLDCPEATEIMVVDNRSDDPETLAWMTAEAKAGRITLLPYDAPFNWADINNRAAAATNADYLLFLNNDTLALDNGWDTVLRGYLARADVGALGARLLFEDGTIQHAGVILYDDAVAVHEGAKETCLKGGYNDRTRLAHACSAVTGAFLACRRDVFEAAGGFDADRFAVAFNDIDFCLKVRADGRLVLYTPQITFNHLESKSRGYDALDPEKARRAAAENALMRQKWGDLIANDPYYPPIFLRRERPFTRLRAPTP